jgi:uncharacterized repeat protein (TIGR02543 family)
MADIFVSLPSSAASTNFLSYTYTPRLARRLDTNALNEGVSFNHEAPIFQDCSYIRPTDFAPAAGTVTYAFEPVPGEVIRNVIAAQSGALYTQGSIQGEFSTDHGATFTPFFNTQPFDGSSTGVVTTARANLRALNATNLLIRYTLVLTHDDNYQLQFCRDCDDAPSSLRFDFDVPVSLLTLPRHLRLGTSTGGKVQSSPNAQEFQKGQTVKLTAVPDSGYVFRGWYGDALSFENPVTVIMDETKTITANFEPVTNIDRCLDPPAGLVHWWPGDGSTVDAVTRKSGIVGGDLSYDTGFVDTGFSFDGLQDYFVVSGPSLNVPWTVVAWVNRQDSQKNGAALMSNETGAIKIEQAGTAPKLGLTRYGVGDWSFTYSAPLNRWTHLAFVATTGSTRLYVNGQLEDTLPNTIVLPVARIGIGKDAGFDLFHGALDELLVFNRALSTEEIEALYSAGKSGLCKPPRLVGIFRQPNAVAVRILGSVGQKAVFNRSTDLVTWRPYSTNVNTTGLYDFLVPAAQHSAFFRVAGGK